ncbi:hypothetical protein [Psychrobacillus sp. FJAT-21963]|nr:hypothetical protein [Psychrobacillus sp. FJAT-21963]
MEINTKYSLIQYQQTTVNYGFTIVIKFPSADENVYSYLESQLRLK